MPMALGNVNMKALVIRFKESDGTYSRIDSAAVPSSKRLRNAVRVSRRILVAAGGLVLAWYTVSFFRLFVG
jgi:hypothetical protein